MRGREIWEILKATFAEFKEDKAPRLAGSLAYYSLFAIGPLLLIAVSIAGIVFGADSVRAQVTSSFGGLVGAQGAEAMDTVLRGTAGRVGGGLVGTVVGVALLLFAAGGVFAHLKDALNTIWEVEPVPQHGGFVRKLRQRFVGTAAALGLGFLLLVALLLTAGLAALHAWLVAFMPGSALVWLAVNVVVALALETLLFAAIFKLLPDGDVRWRDVWIGAFATAVLFEAGKLAIGYYLGRAAFVSAFGAAGGIVAFLVWVYFSALILFVGAEFTQVWARRRGDGVRPDPDARAVTEERRAQQGIPRRGSS